jgi:hypothetical protein
MTLCESVNLVRVVVSDCNRWSEISKGLPHCQIQTGESPKKGLLPLLGVHLGSKSRGMGQDAKIVIGTNCGVLWKLGTDSSIFILPILGL